MAQFIEEILDDLATETIITAKGTDGFFDQMPDISASPVVAVYDNGGEGNHRNPVENVSVGFRIRAADADDAYSTARTLAQSVYDRYHQMTDTTLGTTRVLWALGDTLPRSSGRDSANRSLVEFNMTFGTDG